MISSPKLSQPKLVNLYFQVHQPRRLKAFHFFDIGKGKPYFDDAVNGQLVKRIAKDCYLPINTLLLRLIRQHPEIKITFSISGTAIDQFIEFAPGVLDSFRELAKTGSVEFLAETYYHSLAALWSTDEFELQVGKHRDAIEKLFGIRPSVFRNTELIFNNEIAGMVDELGFKGMHVEGSGNLIGNLAPNQLFRHTDTGLPLFSRDYRLSDDIAFRYSDLAWDEWPLSAEKFVTWLCAGKGALVCLGMDYETFGEHHKETSGILDFFEQLLLRIHDSPKLRLANASTILDLVSPDTPLCGDRDNSWADDAKDLSAWLGNEMQRDAFHSLNRLLPEVLATGSGELISSHRYLQTSDHFYYMCTKTEADGKVHDYFSPHPSPYEAFITFMNIVSDLEFRIRKYRKVKAGMRGAQYSQVPVLEY
jgi:alpha-amylase